MNNNTQDNFNLNLFNARFMNDESRLFYKNEANFLFCLFTKHYVLPCLTEM